MNSQTIYTQKAELNANMLNPYMDNIKMKINVKINVKI